MKLLADFERVERVEEERVNLVVRMEREKQDLQLVIERVKGVEEERSVLLAHMRQEREELISGLERERELWQELEARNRALMRLERVIWVFLLGVVVFGGIRR